MKGCHDCKVTEDIAAGVYENAAWDETPCATCEVMSGVSRAMEYDDGRVPAEDGDQIADDSPQTGEVLPVEVMRQMVVGLLRLAPELRDVVALRFSGMKYREIAQMQGVTMACVEKRHRLAMKQWPVLRELFPVKASKQWRRKPHHKSAAFGNKQGVTGPNCGKTARKQGVSAARIRRGRRLP
jgi:hypothetical protein